MAPGMKVGQLTDARNRRLFLNAHQSTVALRLENSPAKDTIFAVASGQGRSAVAIVRISGPLAKPVLDALCGPFEFRPRRASLRELKASTGEVLDRGLGIWFPEPHSFTGDDVVELQLHGGRAVIAAVCEELAARYGLRAAAPGEFTRRAFDNGKLDLTAVEGLADLVAADTQAQRRQALHQLGGGIYRLYEAWRERLVAVLAFVEAEIEFPEEGLPDSITHSVRAELSTLLAEMRRHIDDGHKGERLRHGLSVAIIGAPNVGKSSLLNLLAGRDVAIVSEHAGTTRDVVEVNLELGGYPVTVADTAGIRDTEDEVEIEGVRRSRQRATESDIKILMADVSMGPAAWDSVLSMVDEGTILVLNKIDLGVPIDAFPATGALPKILLSVKAGAGIDQLLKALESMARERLASGSHAVVTRVRHRQAIEEVIRSLERAVESKRMDEFVAEEIRIATRSIGRVTGRVDVEQMLDVLFREFCIGK